MSGLDDDVATVVGDRRARRLAEACELVVQVMNLRAPQAEALRRITKLLQRLPRKLSECSQEELLTFLTDGDRWQHTNHPVFTASLATGVGKTRLAGAIMALLFLAKESRTFLILAPTREVLRRFSDALDPTFREYIFVESGFVPEPFVVTSDQIDGPAGVEDSLDIVKTGPTVYLLSPQLITTSERFRAKQKFSGKSPLEHLRNKQDLVVIFDEAHHVGRISEKETAKWTHAVRELQPALQLGITATPRGEPGENVIYEYPLKQALQEQHYTKDVHLLVRDFDKTQLSDEDIDRATIKYALDRLAVKERAAQQADTAKFPPVKPVCVFFADDVDDAEWVATVLRESHGIPDEQVLVTHSASSETEEALERLVSIETMANPVRVVVNVKKLLEGWDVRNVYVIAPLRAMATFIGATQAMGRGLRLPAGRRVGIPELDSLDVVCFGKSALKRIVEEATKWLGREVREGEAAGGVTVDDYASADLTAIPLTLDVRREVPSLNLQELEPIDDEVSIDVRPDALSRSARMAVDDLDLARLRSKHAQQRVVRISRGAFLDAAVMRVLRVASKYLSDDLHFNEVKKVVETWLEATKIDSNDVDFDPADIGEQIGRIIVDGAKRRALKYQATGRPLAYRPEPFSVERVQKCPPGQQPASPKVEDLDIAASATFIPTQVVRGFDKHLWQLSLHAAYAFDSLPELRLAWLVDHDDDVDWWVRNEPRRLRINTPAGVFSPDFLVFMKDGTLYLVEVKGSIYWENAEGEARIKAKSAARWAELQSQVSGTKVIFGVALDSVVDASSSFAAVREALLLAAPH